tara:strand:- start:131 stop:577 length:447 start_codon:yes stop_codon:yes gene_type:complete
MLKIIIFFIIIFSINTNSFAANKSDYNCSEIEKVAMDMGYKVSKMKNKNLELIKDGKYTYAEIDKEFCSVTLVSKISKTTSDKIKSLQVWNNKKGMIGKGVYSENNIYFEQTMLLLNAPEELISMQFIIYEVEVYKFYQSLNIRKFNI